MAILKLTKRNNTWEKAVINGVEIPLCWADVNARCDGPTTVVMKVFCDVQILDQDQDSNGDS